MKVIVDAMVVDLRSQPGGKSGEMVIASLAVPGRFRSELVECIVGKLTNGVQPGERYRGEVDLTLRAAVGKVPARLGGYIEKL